MAELAPASQPDAYRLGFAGDTFNMAWYLAMLSTDVAVSYFTAVGDDAISGRMLKAIADSGINTGHIRAIPEKSVGLDMIALDKGERSFSYWRGQSAAKCLAQDKAALQSAMAQSDMIYFSGITLAILDAIGRDTLLESVQTARSAGKRVAFDPNLRPHLWDSPAQMTETMMRAAAVCDIALPSFEDEGRWFGHADPTATLKRYRAAGAGIVIVKNGANPIIFQHAGEAGSVPLDSVTSVVDTTAAGDSFNAAILAGLATEAALPSVIAQACRLARQVVQGNGALVPIELSFLDQFA